MGEDGTEVEAAAVTITVVDLALQLSFGWSPSGQLGCERVRIGMLARLFFAVDEATVGDDFKHATGAGD